MAPSRRPSAPPLVFLVEGEKGGVRSFRMPPVMPSPDLRRGGHPGAAFGDCPRTSTWRTRGESFACEAESFACERFSFRMRSTKPLKTFCFSRPRNFRFRGFQCYQSLAADFAFALSWPRFPVVGRRSVTEFSLSNKFTLATIRLFGNRNFDHVTEQPQTSAEASLPSGIGWSAGAVRCVSTSAWGSE